MSKFEKGRLRARVEKNFGTAKRYQEKISSRLNVQAEDWQRRVGEGLQRIDTVFDQTFAFPQLAPQLQLVTASGAQLTQRDMQQVAYYVATEEGSNTSSKSGGSRRQRRAREARMRRELSPAALRFMKLLLLLMLLLAACNTVGQTGPVTIESAPTTQVEAAPSPAPNPPATEEPQTDNTESEETTDEEVVEEETEEPTEEETVGPGDTPEIDATRIPESEVILAAEAAGVTLTPEAVAQFVSTRESGAARKVMYRLAGSGETATVEVARSDADGNTTYEVIPTPGATSVSEDPETDGILLVMANTDLVFSINTNAEGASEVTTEVTPEPEPAPSPAPTEEAEPDPTVEPEPTETPNTPNESPFSDEELFEGITQFPLIENDIGVVSFRIKFEEFITNPINLGQGFSSELSVKGWYLDSNGDQQYVIIPIAIKGPDGDANINGYYFESFDWEEMDAERLIDSIRLSYWRTHQEQYDDPGTWINGGNGDGVDINEGDVFSIPLSARYNGPIYTNPGYGPVANFGKEARQGMYTESSYQRFLNTGDITELELTPEAQELGLPENILWSLNNYNDVFAEDL